MTSTRLALFAFAISLTAACSFTPYQQAGNQIDSPETGPSQHDTGTTGATVPAENGGAATAADDSVIDDPVKSVNPYLMDRKSVSASASKRFELAIQAMQGEDWLSAQEHLIWLTQEYPQYSGPYVNLAITYLETENLAKAEESFRWAIAANPKNLAARNQLAIFYREQGRFQDAEAEYQAALKVWPEHADSHRNLGILYDLYMGRLEEALHHYHDYQRLNNAPDRQMAGWIVDIKRRLNQVAMQ